MFLYTNFLTTNPTVKLSINKPATVTNIKSAIFTTETKINQLSTMQSFANPTPYRMVPFSYQLVFFTPLTIAISAIKHR